MVGVSGVRVVRATATRKERSGKSYADRSPPSPWNREHGKWYTVWQDDPEDPSGYRFLKTVATRPSGEDLNDIYNIANGLQDEDDAPEFLGSMAKFIRDFGAM